MGTALLIQGKCPCPHLPMPLSQKQSQGKVVEGGIKPKLLSPVQVDQRSRLFFYQKGLVSLFSPLPLKLILHFLKANFRTNGESGHKIRWVYANSNFKNANSALIVWSQPQRRALQALSSSKQLTSQSSQSAPLNKQEGTEKISREIFLFCFVSPHPLPFGGKYFCPQNARFTKMLAKLHVTPSKAAAHAGLNWPSLLNRPELLWAGPSLLPAARVPRETRDQQSKFPAPTERAAAPQGLVSIPQPSPACAFKENTADYSKGKGLLWHLLSFRGSRQRFLLHGLSPASSHYNQRDALGCWSFLSTKNTCFECWIWARLTPPPLTASLFFGNVILILLLQSRGCKSTIKKLHIRKLEFKHGLNKTTPNPS